MKTTALSLAAVAAAALLLPSLHAETRSGLRDLMAEGSDLRDLMARGRFRALHADSADGALLERIASDSDHARSVSADEGYAFLRSAVMQRFTDFPDMPHGFRAAFDGALVSSALFEDPALGRMVLLFTDLSLLHEPERFSGEGLALLRAELMHCLRRGKLVRLNHQQRYDIVVHGLEELLTDASLFPDELHSLAVTTAIDASRATDSTIFVSRAIVYLGVTGVARSDANGPSAFYRSADAASSIQEFEPALAAAKLYVTRGIASGQLPEEDAALLGHALTQAAGEEDPGLALAILRQALDGLLPAA